MSAKDPAKVRAGKIGMARRWGPRRVVRLDQLDPSVANVIRAILKAEENAAARDREGGQAA